MLLTQLEQLAIEHFREKRQEQTVALQLNPPHYWVYLGLRILMEAGGIIRENRIAPMAGQVTYKEDGSPVTTTDRNIETLAIKTLALIDKGISFEGEEFGGSINVSGTSIAMDPIDGTWAFINRFDTIASSLLVVDNGEPQLGMVLNPTSGEIAYGGKTVDGRLLQFSIFGEKIQGMPLPLDKGRPESRLVTVHPNRHGHLLERVYELWRNNEIHFVRSPGGSPAHALMESAKGSSNYLNLWTKEAAKPYDLAAAALLLRSAGGEIFDLHGEPITPLKHSGPFYAINGNDLHSSLPELLRKSLLSIT